MKLILASTSFIRSQILTDAGYTFEAIAPDESSEPSPRKQENSKDYVLRAARGKCLNVSKKHRGAITIGSDQVVQFEGEILRKVKNQEEAIARLQSFSGRKHELVGGWCLARGDQIIQEGLSIVEIECFELSKDEIKTYIETEKPLSSVACYYLEGQGIQLIKHLNGDYRAALGLDLLKIQEVLRKQL